MKPLDHKQLITVSRPKEDEIDVLQVAFYLMNLVYKHRLAIVVTLVIGVACGYFHYRSKPDRYTGTFSCKVPYINETELGAVIESINRYVGEGNHLGLTREFGFEKISLQSLTDVRLIPAKNPADFLCKIQATVTHPAAFEPVQKQLISTFKNIFQRELESDRFRQNTKLALINEEIARIEGILNTATSGDLLRKHENAEALVRLKIDLQNERIELLNQQKDLGAISVVENFPKYTTASTKGYLPSLLMFTALSILILTAYIFVAEASRLVKERKRMKQSNVSTLNGWLNLNVSEKGNDQHPQELENVG